MTPVHWIAVWIVGLIVAIGGVLYVLRDKDPYNEQDCRATLERSNMLTWVDCERAIEEMMRPPEPIDMMGQPVMGMGNITYRDAFAFIHEWQLYEKENGVTISFGEARKMFGELEGFSDRLNEREDV